MAKKLGKKARKFAKKNLQSVMKRRRKLKSMFTKKSPSRRVSNQDSPEESKKSKIAQQAQGDPKGVALDGTVSNNDLGYLFTGDDSDLDEDDSDSDGYLSEISIHLWATGEERLSACSFFIIWDIASKFSSGYLDTCLRKSYRPFIANCKFMELGSLKHIEYLVQSVMELYSLDIQKSYQIMLVSMQQLASILRQALKTKKKDELNEIHCLQYINSISIWFSFLSASLLFDCLEHRGNNNADRTERKHADFSSLLKVPKQLLKS